MKKYLLFISFLLLSIFVYTTYAPASGRTNAVATLANTAELNVATADTEVPVSATAIYVDSVIIRAKAANTGLVYVGGPSADATSIVLEQGDQVVFTARPGQKINLADIYVDVVTNGDDAYASYATGMDINIVKRETN